MKCLLVKTADLAINDLTWGIVESGNECESLSLDCKMLDYDEKSLSVLNKYLENYHADLIFTMNFSPTVSKACQLKGIPYASWIYDVPLQSLYNSEAFNEVNFFFHFDKNDIEVQKKRGLRNLFHLPLAANVSRMGKLNLTKEDEKVYSCDISFVGGQYADGRYAYYRENLPEEYQTELNNIAYSLIGRWDGKDRLRNSMSENLINLMVDLSDDIPERVLGMSNRQYFEEAIISHAVAYTERRLMMERVSDLHPRWYGGNIEDKNKIKGVEYHPWLYYEDTLPKAYNFSRINLSICLHSISSGIPLRVFDIMGAGGFILTNYQSEIEEFFELGKEIVVYHNFDEMYELAKFFLAHESARLNILLAGYTRVCNEYNYKEAVIKMLNTVFHS